MQGSTRALLALLLGHSVLQLCHAHGKLTKPTPRDGISIGRAGLNQNNPVSFEPGCTKENTCDAFVCREAAPNPNVPVTTVVAGESLELGWMFTALHVGDCSVYITYDVDKPRSQQKFVKIANILDCKSYSAWNIKIPSILPAGRAILRWDWVALHIWPKTENFVQCVDINIESASSTKASELSSFSITNPPIYPDDGNDGVGFRNAYGSGAQDMTGPSCIDNTINDCSLTAPGTLRNTDSRRGGSGVIVPTPQPQPAPAPQQSPPPPTPTAVLDGCSVLAGYCNNCWKPLTFGGKDICSCAQNSGCGINVGGSGASNLPAPCDAHYKKLAEDSWQINVPAQLITGYLYRSGAWLTGPGWSGGPDAAHFRFNVQVDYPGPQHSVPLAYFSIMIVKEMVADALFVKPDANGGGYFTFMCSNVDACPEERRAPFIAGKKHRIEMGLSADKQEAIIDGKRLVRNEALGGVDYRNIHWGVYFFGGYGATNVRGNGGGDDFVIKITDASSAMYEDGCACTYTDVETAPCSVTPPTPANPTTGDETLPTPQPQRAPMPLPPAPIPLPTSSPPADRSPVPPPPPALVPATAPSGDCVANGPAYYTAACAALTATCEQHSFCKRISAGSTSTALPTGACVSNDPNIDYSVACKSLEAMCEQFSFCKRVSSLTQSSSMHSTPTRRLRRLRRSADHTLMQRRIMTQGKFADEAEMECIECAAEDPLHSVASQAVDASRNEL